MHPMNLVWQNTALTLEHYGPCSLFQNARTLRIWPIGIKSHHFYTHYVHG